jgi:hypothetical protein
MSLLKSATLTRNNVCRVLRKTEPHPSEIDIFNEFLPNCNLRNFVQNARLTIGYYPLYFSAYVDKRQFAGLYVYRAGQCLDELGFWRFTYH